MFSTQEAICINMIVTQTCSTTCTRSPSRLTWVQTWTIIMTIQWVTAWATARQPLRLYIVLSKKASMQQNTKVCMSWISVQSDFTLLFYIIQINYMQLLSKGITFNYLTLWIIFFRAWKCFISTISFIKTNSIIKLKHDQNIPQHLHQRMYTYKQSVSWESSRCVVSSVLKLAAQVECILQWHCYCWCCCSLQP
jgi:hypothetical protein